MTFRATEMCREPAVKRHKRNLDSSLSSSFLPHGWNKCRRWGRLYLVMTLCEINRPFASLGVYFFFLFNPPHLPVPLSLAVDNFAPEGNKENEKRTRHPSPTPERRGKKDIKSCPRGNCFEKL